MLRLMKLLRLFRGIRIFTRWQMEFGFSYRRYMLIQIFALVLVVSHWIACILGLCHRLQIMECSSTDDVSDECADTWLTTAHDGWQNGGGRSIFSSYVFALHASMSILVHPHTYNPTGPGE